MEYRRQGLPCRRAGRATDAPVRALSASAGEFPARGGSVISDGGGGERRGDLQEKGR